MYKKILLIWLLVLINLINISVFVQASTNTFIRTEDDLKIHDSIVVTEKVKKAALETPKVDATEKIYDFADLFTVDEEEKLYYSVMEFIESSEMDMAIVTIDKNNKSSSEAYADDFYDYNDFGIGIEFDGVLFLIDMDQRVMHISTTGRAIKIYNDYIIERILDDAYYYISNEEYYDTANSFVKNAIYYAEYQNLNNSKGYVHYEGTKRGVNFRTNSIVSLIITVIFIWFAASKHKLVKKATDARFYLVKGSFNLTEKKDIFITSNTSKVYVPPPEPPTSSSSISSSSHISSSGRSHGGGSRRF